MMSEPDTPTQSAETVGQAQKSRNMWLGIALAGFVVIVAAITMVRLSQGTYDRAAEFYDETAMRVADRSMTRATRLAGRDATRIGVQRAQTAAGELE